MGFLSPFPQELLGTLATGNICQALQPTTDPAYFTSCFSRENRSLKTLTDLLSTTRSLLTLLFLRTISQAERGSFTKISFLSGLNAHFSPPPPLFFPPPFSADSFLASVYKHTYILRILRSPFIFLKLNRFSFLLLREPRVTFCVS